MTSIKVNGKTKWSVISIGTVIAIVGFIFAIEDRYASAADVTEGFDKITAAISALEQRITRGEFETSHRYWISVKFDLDRRFGMGCELCGPSDQTLYTQAATQIDQIALRLLRD
jgi:hypothetical protein